MKRPRVVEIVVRGLPAAVFVRVRVKRVVVRGGGVRAAFARPFPARLFPARPRGISIPRRRVNLQTIPLQTVAERVRASRPRGRSRLAVHALGRVVVSVSVFAAEEGR